MMPSRKSSRTAVMKTDEMKKGGSRSSMFGGGVLHEGFIGKWPTTGIIKGYQQRYFILDGHYLRYYLEKPSETTTEEPRGVYDALKIKDTVVDPSSGEVFTLYFQDGSSMRLKGRSAENTESWTTAIEVAQSQGQEQERSRFETMKTDLTIVSEGTITIQAGLLGIDASELRDEKYGLQFNGYTGKSNAEALAQGRIKAGYVLTHVNDVDQTGKSYIEVLGELKARPIKLSFRDLNAPPAPAAVDPATALAAHTKQVIELEGQPDGEPRVEDMGRYALVEAGGSSLIVNGRPVWQHKPTTGESSARCLYFAAFAAGEQATGGGVGENYWWVGTLSAEVLSGSSTEAIYGGGLRSCCWRLKATVDVHTPDEVYADTDALSSTGWELYIEGEVTGGSVEGSGVWRDEARVSARAELSAGGFFYYKVRKGFEIAPRTEPSMESKVVPGAEKVTELRTFKVAERMHVKVGEINQVFIRLAEGEGTGWVFTNHPKKGDPVCDDVTKEQLKKDAMQGSQRPASPPRQYQQESLPKAGGGAMDLFKNFWGALMIPFGGGKTALPGGAEVREQFVCGKCGRSNTIEGAKFCQSCGQPRPGAGSEYSTADEEGLAQTTPTMLEQTSPASPAPPTHLPEEQIDVSEITSVEDVSDGADMRISREDVIMQQLITDQASAQLLIPFGDLELEQEVGRGVSSVVFKGRFSRSIIVKGGSKIGTEPGGAVCAIKVLHERVLQTEMAVQLFREFFAREVAVLCKIEHENVLMLYGLSAHNGSLHIVTDFFPLTLEVICKGKASHPPPSGLQHIGGWTEETCQNLAVQLARGMAHLHDNQIVHRDLKPANALITADGQKLVIADFGLSKIVDEYYCSMTGQIGSPAFMANEMVADKLSNKMLDYHQCDVYSFGVVLNSMWAQEMPYMGMGLNPLQLLLKVRCCCCAAVLLLLLLLLCCCAAAAVLLLF
jgi:hypothetical protein